MLEHLKNILSKVIIETKTRNLASSNKSQSDDDDNSNWLRAAVIADDVEMSDLASIDITFDDSNAS
jgi:hypothetical protein